MISINNDRINFMVERKDSLGAWIKNKETGFRIHTCMIMGCKRQWVKPTLLKAS